MDTLTTDLLEKAKSDGISLAEDTVDDVLTYALFPQVGLKFLINTAIFSRSGGSQGIGFAIPSNMAREIVDELVEHGAVSRGWLGVRISEIPAKLATARGVTSGVLVASVDENGPAAGSGLHDGDIVTAINGEPMTDVTQLRMFVAAIAPGQVARLDVARDAGPSQVSVTLGERPSQPTQAFGGR